MHQNQSWLRAIFETQHYWPRLVYINGAWPIERKRVVAELTTSTQNQYSACLGDKIETYASATYYKGEKGDEVIILVPQTSKSTWAAVENIIKKYNVQ